MSDKLTDTQYAALRTFACNPYLTEWGSWYSATHIAMASDTMRKQTMNWLRSQGYIERAHIEFHSYFVITPAGIAAHDKETATRVGVTNFAAHQVECAAQREKADAARDAKRIIVEDKRIYQAGNHETVTVRVVEMVGGGYKLAFDSALLPPNQIKDMIALLQEAERELARRTEAR
jgi:hypothetical protein